MLKYLQALITLKIFRSGMNRRMSGKPTLICEGFPTLTTFVGPHACMNIDMSRHFNLPEKFLLTHVTLVLLKASVDDEMLCEISLPGEQLPALLTLKVLDPSVNVRMYGKTPLSCKILEAHATLKALNPCVGFQVLCEIGLYGEFLITFVALKFPGVDVCVFVSVEISPLTENFATLTTYKLPCTGAVPMCLFVSEEVLPA